jgi:hypothetical protein
MIATANYDHLIGEGRLAPYLPLSTAPRPGNRKPTVTQRKRVPVYAVRLRKTRGIAYTIFFLPEKLLAEINSNTYQLSYIEATSKSTSGKGNRAEIGIASFMDTKAVESQERFSMFRRFPYHEGTVGRPKLSRCFRIRQQKDKQSIRHKAVLLTASDSDIQQCKEPDSLVPEDQEYIDLVEVGVLEAVTFPGNISRRSGGGMDVVPRSVLTGETQQAEAQNFVAERRADMLTERQIDSTVVDTDEVDNAGVAPDGGSQSFDPDYLDGHDIYRAD